MMPPSKKTPLLILTLLFPLITILVFAGTMVISDKAVQWPWIMRQSSGPTKQDIAKQFEDVYFVDIDPVIVNLQKHENRYVKAAFTIEVNENGNIAMQQESYRLVVASILNEVMSSYTLDILETHEGKMSLKRKIRDAINQKLKGLNIREVFFRDLMFQ